MPSLYRYAFQLHVSLSESTGGCEVDVAWRDEGRGGGDLTDSSVRGGDTSDHTYHHNLYVQHHNVQCRTSVEK